jgi:hypothetical protein
MATFNIEITLDVKTCSKGHIYAVPHWLDVTRYRCPMCARVDNDTLDEAQRQEFEHRAKLQKRISALQGVVTRMKRRK